VNPRDADFDETIVSETLLSSDIYVWML
jgi:hypothetical protein